MAVHRHPRPRRAAAHAGRPGHRARRGTRHAGGAGLRALPRQGKGTRGRHPDLAGLLGGLADKVGGRTIQVPGNRLSFTLLEPLGVTAHIVPWNYPLLILVRSCAPALALGNTCVVKPAEDTSLSALKFAEL